MRAVLGIDAAWTATNPSGVAVAAEGPEGWRLMGVASSYEGFRMLAADPSAARQRPSGSLPDARGLLASASQLCGCRIDLVAMDMPLARTAIVGRRASDNHVSRAYGARKCGTHTPNAARPGRISDDIREGFGHAGYPLLTDAIAPPGLIEVYPHPALLELTAAPVRLPYKASKVRSYWPAAGPAERRDRLFRQWREIAARLDDEIAGVAAALPALATDASGVEIKAYEDSLDAIVCAWVAICALAGRAIPYGDQDSAIWIPMLRPPPSTTESALPPRHRP